MKKDFSDIIYSDLDIILATTGIVKKLDLLFVYLPGLLDLEEKKIYYIVGQVKRERGSVKSKNKYILTNVC